jgi:radical SAM superfamily enzyme YgiQ (UPF0313 family)
MPAVFNHVLCAYPYRRELGHFGFLPPIGLEQIAAVIQPHARTLDLVDLRKDRRRTRDFLRPETDLVCFSVNWDRDGEFLREEIRSAPPGVRTIVGGRHASEDPGRWLAECPNVQIVVRGDGEEIVEDICAGKPLEQIAGISFRRNGQIVHNPARNLGPIRDDVTPLRRARKCRYPVILGGTNMGQEMDMVAGSRGCPFNCTFCSFNRNPWGQKRAWSGRTPESIVNELAGIPAYLVAFTDDLFTFDMARVERICDLILERGIRKKYIINARLEVAKRPDVLEKMHRAGFAWLLLGIESAQDKTLRAMRKGFDTAKVREYCSVLKHYPFFLHGYFILGNVGESVEEILQIGPFAREIGLSTISLSQLRSSPYSGLEELVAANPNYHISPNGRVYSDEISLDELHQLRRRINLRFYMPGQVLRVARRIVQNDGLALLPGVLPRAPAFVGRAVLRWLRRKKKRRGKK